MFDVVISKSLLPKVSTLHLSASCSITGSSVLPAMVLGCVHVGVVLSG